MLLLLTALYVWTHDDYFVVKKRGLELVTDDDTHFIVNYKINSTTLSAQNVITINTTAWAYGDFQAKHRNDNLTNMTFLYIYFLDSSLPNEQDTPNGTFEPLLVMTKGTDGRFRGGPYQVTYQEEGEKCILLSTKPIEFLPSLCNTNQQPFVKITSVDSIIQYRNNKLVASLTWVLVAFSVVSARDPLFSMFAKRARSKEDEARNNEKDKKTTGSQKCRVRNWFRKTKHTEPKIDDKKPDEDKELN